MLDSYHIIHPDFRSELLTNLLTLRSDATRADVIGGTLEEVDPNDIDDAKSGTEQTSRREKEKDTKKNKSIKPPKADRLSTRRGSNLQVENQGNLSRAKSSKGARTKSRDPSGKGKEMEWDGKKWRVKGSIKDDDLSDRSHRSDRSEVSFMNDEHQAKLMDKMF